MLRYFKRASAFIIIVLILLMNFLIFTLPAFGATQHLFDNAELMSEQDQAYVEEYLADMSGSLNFDIIAVTTYGYSQSDITSFADDFYDYGGFGYGSDHDGVIFVIDMDAGKMVLVTTGYGTEAITDYGEDLIYDAMMDNIRSGDYVTALTANYADTVRDFVDMAREGASVDEDTPGHDGYDWYQDPEEYGYDSGSRGTGLNTGAVAGAGGLSALIGAGAGFASSQRQKSKLKTVRRKTQANSYARRDSLVLTRKQDRFLYSTIAVTPRPKHEMDDHDRHHGGGTTMHMGSSGVPHGGGHARGF